MNRVILYLFILFFPFLLAANTGKKVSILGDSYSTFQGFVDPVENELWYLYPCDSMKTDVNNVRQTWWHQFISANGYQLEKNNSYSGSTICNTGYEGADFSDRSFISRMDNLGSPDIIIIFGATNDSWANSPIGDYKWDNWTNEDLKYFRPALCYMLSHMQDRFINVQIIYLINDGLKTEITGAIKTVCDHYNIRYITLQDIDKTAGHPNVKGMKQIAEQLHSAIQQYK